MNMHELAVVFSSPSDIESRIVRGLLESHGIASLLSSGAPQSIFPVGVGGIAEVRISVRPEDADEARRVIESHRVDQPGSRVIPLRGEISPLERCAGYTFRDHGLLEHALTHTSRANEDVSGGVFDNESLEFLGDAVLGFAIADLLFRRFPDRDEGWKSKMKATLVSTASLARSTAGCSAANSASVIIARTWSAASPPAGGRPTPTRTRANSDPTWATIDATPRWPPLPPLRRTRIWPAGRSRSS